MVRKGAAALTATLMVLTSVTLTACGPSACPAVGYVGGVTLHLPPERAQSLAVLQLELCQDTRCTTRQLLPDPGAAASPSSPVGQAGTPIRVPLAEHRADGGVDFRLWDGALTDHPLDVTATGRDVHGMPIAATHVQLQPVTTYPHGRQCGGPTTAEATLDAAGLRAG